MRACLRFSALLAGVDVPRPLRLRELFATLAEHDVRYVAIGGIAAVFHGSALATTDADICPDPDPTNLERLCAALRDMHARLRTPNDENGVDFDCHPVLLAQMQMVNLVTDFGNFDLSFRPAAFDAGYEDLIANASTVPLGGAEVIVASLDDVIRSKQTANRLKDQAALPHLYALRDEIATRETSKQPPQENTR